MADVHDAGSTVDSHPTAKGLAVQLKDIRKRLPLRVLSPADWEHWTRWGYVIVNAAVTHRKHPSARRPAVGVQRDEPD